jgi:signal peptidase I
MYQYLRFLPKSISTEFKIKSASPKELKLFFLKRALFIFFVFYCIAFLGVATPFLPTHSPVVYVPGFFYIMLLIVRFVVQLNFYKKHSYIECIITRKNFHLLGKNISQTLNSVKNCRYTLSFFDFLILSEGNEKIYLPLFLFSEYDKGAFLSHFGDMVPSRTSFWKGIKDSLDAVFIALLMAVHIIAYVVQNYYIPTSSMRNTLIEGDHLFAEKISYGLRIPPMLFLKKPVHLSFLQFRDVKRGDVVIFTPPKKEKAEVEYIKRVIALEGDRFALKDGFVYVNGVKQNEPYVLGKTYYFGDEVSQIEGIVPKGRAIVLGDNRNDSQDSRYFGYVPIESIHARAVFLYFNYERFKKLDFGHFGPIK